MEKKERDLTPLADHLAEAGRLGWGRQRHLLLLSRRWPDIVGRLAAEQSDPAYFRKHELWIYVRSGILMQQLSFCKLDILAKINALLREEHPVEDLRWTLPPADFLPLVKKEESRLPAAVDHDAEQQFQAMATAVADPDAREALCRLWHRFAELSG